MVKMENNVIEVTPGNVSSMTFYSREKEFEYSVYILKQQTFCSVAHKITIRT
jgi:hypothetical protein